MFASISATTPNVSHPDRALASRDLLGILDILPISLTLAVGMGGR